MAEPSYGKVFPFEADQEAGDAEWRLMAKAYGDGIVNDLDGLSFSIQSKSGSDRSFVVQLGEYRIQGINFTHLEDTVTLTPSAPSGSNKRADRVIAKYDLGAKTVTVELDSSGAESAGTPVPPSLVRNPLDDWSAPLWIVSGAAGPATGLTFTDQRSWSGGVPSLVVNAAALDPNAPIGARALALDTKHEWNRERVGSAAAWVDLDGPGFRAIGLPSTRVPSGQAPQYGRLRSGLVCLRGGYAQADGSNFVAGTTYSLGSLVAGYRPGQPMNFVADYAYTTPRAQHMRISIQVDGTITGTLQVPDVGGSSPVANGVSAFRIDGISFVAEN
jgi:hypothetical protein